MKIEAAHLSQILPAGADVAGWADALNRALPAASIDTPLRVAHFLAQALHESAHFAAIEENLNYSSGGLVATFPKHFTTDEAHTFAHNPQAIANRVYSGRMGNGDAASGDGFRFRGRGLFQVTGRNNYAECSIALYVDLRLLDYPEHLATPLGAAFSAAWYWGRNDLNALADADNLDGISDVVNIGRQTAAVGDSNGFEDRRNCFNLCRAVFGA